MSDTNIPNNNNMPEDNNMPENNEEKYEPINDFLERLMDENNKAGSKLDAYTREHFTHEYGTDEYERNDLIQTVVDYLVSDILSVGATENALIFAHNYPQLKAKELAITKYEDMFIALYRLLDTCKDDHLLAFLPKRNHNYNPESCGGFRE